MHLREHFCLSFIMLGQVKLISYKNFYDIPLQKDEPSKICSTSNIRFFIAHLLVVPSLYLEGSKS